MQLIAPTVDKVQLEMVPTITPDLPIPTRNLNSSVKPEFLNPKFWLRNYIREHFMFFGHSSESSGAFLTKIVGNELGVQCLDFLPATL